MSLAFKRTRRASLPNLRNDPRSGPLLDPAMSVALTSRGRFGSAASGGLHKIRLFPGTDELFCKFDRNSFILIYRVFANNRIFAECSLHG